MTSCSTVWNLPLESKEWIGPLTVLLNDVPYLTGWRVAVVHEGFRPTAFADPEANPGDPTQLGVRVGHGTPVGTLPRGRYHIWIQIGADTDFEEPVLSRAGTVVIV